jgi:serine/threonine protein kinase
MADNEDKNVIDGYQWAADIAGSGGGSSHILEVIEPGSQRHLAMKLLNKEHPDFKENKATLKYEAQIAKQLEHPNIVKFESYSSSRDHTYILMEYFRAPNLKLQIKNDRHSVHLRMKKLLDGLCSALQHVHDKGFIHRDIKPENVLVNKAGETRLIDFSLAVKQKGTMAKLFAGKQSSIQGTRTYIAPETIRKRQPTFQTDFYSLGVLIFEMLCGKTPFQAPTPNELLQKHISAEPPPPSEFNKNVSQDMDRLVLKLLSKKPDARGKDMAEISGELRRIKFFIEEPTEKKEDVGSEQKKADLLTSLTSGVLDSRADAEWSEMVRENPELAGKLIARQDEVKAAKAAEKARREVAIKKVNSRADAAAAAKAKAAPPPPAAAPMMPPQPMMMPGYPPGMMMPGMPQGYPPGMMMPGMPPGYPPGMMMPGMPQGMPPGYPPGYPPGAMMPGMPGQGPMPVAPNMPGMPPVTAPPVGVPPVVGAPPPAAPAPAAAAKPAPPPPAAPRPAPAPPAPPVDAEGLEYMTELPDVL